VIAISFLRTSLSVAARRAILQELARVLTPAGVLILIDHNRPRRRVAAAAALIRAPRPPGRTLAERWRRAAHPAAREARAAGVSINALRLLCDERVQMVFGHRDAQDAQKGADARRD
jgi:SAM-dependent methyltransferase